MKKIFLIAFFLINLKNFAQVTSSGTLALVSVTPQIPHPEYHDLIFVCAGDSIVITFKLKSSNINDTIKNWSFHYGYLPPIQGNTILPLPIKNFSNHDFLLMARKIVLPDTFYTFTELVPTSLSDGSIPINVNANGWTSGYLAKTIDFGRCLTPTGLQEYTLDSLNATYTDFNGKKTDLHKNDLLIQQIGNTRTKILILE